jgi:glycosyltransferase involved in cell wall biosynthesis
LLIEAWDKVSQKHNDWQLKICGEGAEYQKLIYMSSKINFPNSVIISNSFSDVVPEFLSSSIFVLTSKFEAFGNVIVEAKVCGVPTISFDAPNGPREIIKDGIDGFIVPVNDVDAIAEKIIYLIENEEVRFEMGRNAKLNSELYSLDKVMKLYIKVITKC